MSNELVPFERQMVLAKAFADSKLFGVQDANQALALMAICEAQGLHPANAVQEYHIIQGRPSLRADAMLTRFQRAGGSVEFTAYTDERVEAKFVHPQGGSLTVDWDMARAKKAGLATAMWTKYPRQMLRSRVISEGVRSLFPGVLGGMYAPEEVSEFEPPKSGIVTPAPDGMKSMDAEYRDQYVSGILLHLDAVTAATIGAVREDAEAKKAWDLWLELDEDERVQVFQKFNTKQKDRWRKLEGAMTKPANGELVQEAIANG